VLDIDASRASLEVETCHSLKESRFEALQGKVPERVLLYTQAKLLRTYPDNLRIDSSNYDPVVCWNHGVQMVSVCAASTLCLVVTERLHANNRNAQWKAERKEIHE
jgi:hypothetical protein